MIRISEIYKTANQALLLHKGRTVLTMLGVIIGVFAVVSLVSMGTGVQNYVTDQFESLGANLVIVAPGKIDFNQDPANSFGNNRLKEKHVDMVKTYAADYITKVTPSVRFGSTATYKTKNYYTSIISVNADAKDIFNIILLEGRFFTDTEVTSKSHVAVISPIVKDELFKNTNPIGKKIKLNDKQFEVIGYTDKKSQEFDTVIYIPYTSAMQEFNIENISSIAIQSNNAEDVDMTIKQVKYALLRDLKEDQFSVISAEDILNSINSILKILTIAIGAIAGISLLVGGIGIMNIMLVSVTERTREIGLRKALGATPKDIATQFLIESVLISVGGGVFGLILGWGASILARSFIRAEVPLWTVFLAFGFSVGVGMLFGTYPAISASKKDPIEALRYE
ncbi:hypothetical protein A2V49_01960 [candidate division WWE3 bacterium RBG_19FT_COMBO_34_6]|uniref:Multidrug ABC transporter substrate-binding protein n=1 Tax=candidate division WWE3 bacterium RBG_19FT_COMBO_34_6 TaxID=1802612 RepID=A0A1F4ULY6_UNCKA|nr:MAG: hypothetical protein A2V49_01960 [candidate division WWE3 bacterium RBG_19FT_COMBO_34_6]